MRYNKYGDTMKKRLEKMDYRKVAILLFCVLFFLCFFYFLFSYKTRIEEKNEFNKILTELSLMDFLHHQNDKNQTENSKKEELEKDAFLLKDFKEVEINMLLPKNEDTKGYIQVEGTSFSYPFVSFKNGFYQNHSYYQKENQIGWVYISQEANMENLQNMVFYADGKRAKEYFSISEVLEETWKKNNPAIFVSTSKTNSIWKPFSVYIQKGFPNTKENAEVFAKKSIIPFSVKVGSKDTILSIISRHSSDEMLILHAKLMKKMNRE